MNARASLPLGSLLLVFSFGLVVGCGRLASETSEVLPASPGPAPTSPEQPFEHVVPSEWPLQASIEGDKIYFQWTAQSGVFLYEKEDCATCQWEMIAENRVTSKDGKYFFWDFENPKWFGRMKFTLAKTISYTVNWPGGYPDLQTYQVFFYGNRGYSYFHNVGNTTSFTL